MLFDTKDFDVKLFREFEEKTTEWMYRRGFNLSKKQQEFIDKHDIALSPAYIGMVRAYYQNRTIWQTSMGNVISGAILNSRREKTVEDNFREALSGYIDLANQTKAWIDSLIALNEEDLNKILQGHVGLLSN